MLRAFRSLLVLLAICSAPSVARAAEPVDLLLVFAADVSRSVDQPKFQLQREGYAAAISDKRVLEAITGGRNRRIAVSFVEWSGVSSQKVLIDWTVIDGPDAAKKFGDQLVELPRSFAERTSIAGGIDFAMGVLKNAPYEAPRRTIDVSGDGTNNSGRDVTLARDEAVAQGVTINGLVDIIEGIAGITLKRNYNLKAPKGVNGRNSDNTLIKRYLGWEPSIRLRDGLEETYKWIHDQMTGASARTIRN